MSIVALARSRPSTCPNCRAGGPAVLGSAASVGTSGQTKQDNCQSDWINFQLATFFYPGVALILASPIRAGEKVPLQ